MDTITAADEFIKKHDKNLVESKWKELNMNMIYKFEILILTAIDNYLFNIYLSFTIYFSFYINIDKNILKKIKKKTVIIL